jgi:hypothetical protein
MPEVDMGEGQRMSADQQEVLAKKLIDGVDAEQRTETKGECPFSQEQLEFLALMFRDILITIGQSPLVLVGYNPVSEAYMKWKNGVRLEK